MGIFYDGYEDSSAKNIENKTFVCGTCGIEMQEIARKDSECPQCGKKGWLITFRCKECGEQIESFKQDMTNPPFCYCDNQ